MRPTRRQLEELRAHHWPGNVRELQHVLERAVILAAGGRFDPGSLLPGGPDVAATARTLSSVTSDEVIPYDRLKELERHSIEAALRESDGRVYGKEGAAELLGTKPTTLTSRIKALRIARSKRSS
jgi:transcriptional regulator with GAF, ATPase, and Fis domain